MSGQRAEVQAPESRTIGDILLARGFVTRERLDAALERQQHSGKPLGQILVEEGAISRLELASALAEQWADIGSVSPDFGLGSGSSGPGAPLVELQELRQSRRVLEERLRDWESSREGAEDAEERARLTARLAGVEAAVAGLQEHDAALEVSRLRQSVGELAAHLDEVAGTVSSLAERSDHSERIDDVDRRLAALGAAVEAAFREMQRRADESSEALASLAAELRSGPEEGVEALTQRLSAIEDTLDGLAHADRVEALAASVESLARAGPAPAPPDLTGELEALRLRLEDLAGGASAANGLEQRAAALEARVDDLAARPAADERIPDLVGELMARVDALTSRPVADGETDGRVAELVVRVEQLAAAVEDVDSRPVGDPGLAGRLDGLAAQVSELAAKPAGDPGLADRVEELAATVATLAVGVEHAREHPEALEALRARVTELASRPTADPGSEAVLRSLTEKIDALEREAAAAEPVAEHLDSLTHRLGLLERADGERAARLDELVEESRLTSHSAREVVSATAELGERLARLEREIAGLTTDLRQAGESATARSAELEARIDAVAARIGEQRGQLPVSVADALAGDGTPRAGGDDQDVERLRMMVERLMHDFADHRRAVSSALSSREFTALLEELAARVDELAAGGVVATPGDGPPPGPRADVRALTSRLDEVEESVRASRDGVFQRLERMMGTIDWRLQRLEHPEPPDETG